MSIFGPRSQFLNSESSQRECSRPTPARARPRPGRGVMVDHEFLRPPVPIPELRVEPAVVLPPDLAFVEVRLGRVERDDLRHALRHGDLDGLLPDAEKLLEVPVAYVLGVVVAQRVDDVRARKLVEKAPGLLELPAVALHRQVPDHGHEVGLEGVGLLDGGLEEIPPKQPRAYVDIRHLNDPHGCVSLPGSGRPAPTLYTQGAGTRTPGLRVSPLLQRSSFPRTGKHASRTPQPLR